MGYLFGSVSKKVVFKMLYFEPRSATTQSTLVTVRNDRMPIQSPSWTEFLYCPVCTNEFAANLRAPITLGCGHSICKNCLTTLHRKQCPYDQNDISKNFENLPINYALLQLTTSINNNAQLEREISPSTVKALLPDELQCYNTSLKCIEELALFLKPSGSISGLLSRPMQRKLVTLINCQLIESEGRTRALRAVRSLGERTVTELILQHQNPHQLSTNLWAAVRGRGCQFLGPAMQEEVLKLVLLALEDGSPLSRKILVMYVVQKLEATFPQASKTSIGHVVQLLYRASCFKVNKRDGDSSLMTLKEEFRTYDALRREHDTQIVQIATESGLRIAPDQWSALLYGDNNHKSHMQSIIDKQQSPSSFAQSVDELMLALQRTGDPANLAKLRIHLDKLSNIDPSLDAPVQWIECTDALCSVREVVFGLIDFIQHHGKNKVQEAYNQHTARFKVSFCRDLQTRGTCARGQNCNFAHSDEELDRYRAKYKKNAMRNIIQNQNNQHKESSSAVNAVSNGPISKVNMNYAKCPPPPPQPLSGGGSAGYDTTNSTIMPSRLNSSSSSSSSSKQIPYRSENSLHHSSSSTKQQQQQQQPHHLRPSNVYNSPGSSTSSNSTPNLSQMQLSPNQVINAKTSPQPGNSRFSFNARGNGDLMHSPYNYHSAQQRSTPLSAPPISNSNYKKQMSPYHNANIMNNNNARHQQQTQQMPSSARMPFNGNGNAFFGQGSSSPIYRSGGGETSGKYMQWQQLRSPSNLYATSNMKSPKSAAGVGNNRISMEPSTSRMMAYQREAIDEVDGPNGSGNRWQQSLAIKSNHHQQQQHAPQTTVSSTYPLFHTPKGGFIRSDSLLATSNADETYENIATNGKYGAIGIKTTESLQQPPQTQWSGLQQTLGNRFDNNGFGSCSSSSTSSIGSNALKTNDTLNPNDDSAHQHSGGFNGNFINIHTPAITTNDDFWNMEDASNEFDIGSLDNRMSVLNILDLINE